MKRATERRENETAIVRRIAFALRNRITRTSVGTTIKEVVVNRRCQQEDVLSPFMWRLVLLELLITLKGVRIYVYASIC